MGYNMCRRQKGCTAVGFFGDKAHTRFDLLF